MPPLLAPIIALYHYALQPLPAFAWLGAPVSAFDVVGAFRLAFSLRQVRELHYRQHISRISATGDTHEDSKTPSEKVDNASVEELRESRSPVRDLVATLVMVHGGEAIAGALPISPSPG